MASSAQLIAAILARVARAAQGGDFSAVLSAEALAEARELAAFAAGDDLEPAYVLGRFHLVRYQILPPGQDEADRAAAVRWFGVLLPWRPELVPAELLPEVARAAPLAGHDAARWHNEALGLLADPRAAHDLAVLNRLVGLLDRTVESASGQDPELSNYQGNLCLALTWRFEQNRVRG